MINQDTVESLLNQLHHATRIGEARRSQEDDVRRLTASLREANMIATVEMDKNLVLEDRIHYLEERINQQATQIKTFTAQVNGCPYCRESGL